MQEFVCDKGHHFTHVAKYTNYLPVTSDSQVSIFLNGKIQNDFIEVYVCPFCKSLNISVAPEENIEGVYVYELTTGEQHDLDALLKQGYKIVNRYSKQYHLEKPKVEAPKA